MKNRILIIALTLSIGVFTACAEKKKTEDKPTTEIILEESHISVEDTIDKTEKRRLDSIRQVKEHGHAH